MTKYYRTKGVRSSKAKHKDKWDGDYGWNTVKMANPKTKFFTGRPEVKFKVSPDQIAKTAIEYGLSKAYYYRNTGINWDEVVLDEQIKLNCLMEIRNLKRKKLNVKEFLTDALKEEVKRKKH